MKIYSTRPASIKAREYRAKNREKDNKYQRDYRLKNLEKKRKASRDYYKNNSEKLLLGLYKSRLKTQYGLTPESYNQMWEDQRGRCACCQCEIKRGAKKSNSACVDHNHATGKVRAILCMRCNLGIAQFGEDPERCELAAAYLRKHN